MDIPSLQAFVAVAESGSFSRAAEQLFITQPAVSKRIAGLEDSLHTQLFDRIGHQVALTEAGRALLPRARRLMEDLTDTQRAIANLSGTVAGPLSVGTSHHVGLHRLPPVLRAYTQRYPEVELNLHFMDSEAACRAVEHGELELAVVTLPTAPPDTLVMEMVWDDPLSVAGNADHPLVQLPHPEPADLARFRAILPSRGTYTREIIEAMCTRHGVNLDVSMSTNYLETIKMLVSIGLGWSALPNTMIDGELRVVQITALEIHRRLGIVTHAAHTLSNAAAALIDVLRK